MTTPERFALLRRELSDALHRQDWLAVAELDDQCQRLLASLPATPAESALHSELLALAELYQTVTLAAGGERDRLAAEVITLKNAQTGSKAYQQGQ